VSVPRRNGPRKRVRGTPVTRQDAGGTALLPPARMPPRRDGAPATWPPRTGGAHEPVLGGGPAITDPAPPRPLADRVSGPPDATDGV